MKRVVKNWKTHAIICTEFNSNDCSVCTSFSFTSLALPSFFQSIAIFMMKTRNRKRDRLANNEIFTRFTGIIQLKLNRYAAQRPQSLHAHLNTRVIYRSQYSERRSSYKWERRAIDPVGILSHGHRTMASRLVRRLIPDVARISHISTISFLDLPLLEHVFPVATDWSRLRSQLDLNAICNKFISRHRNLGKTSLRYRELRATLEWGINWHGVDHIEVCQGEGEEVEEQRKDASTIV